MPVHIGEMLRFIELLAPAREGFGEGGMIDCGRQTRILEQELEIALERPYDGAEAPRLMIQVIDFQDFLFERSEHDAASVQNPKFATSRSAFRANFGFER